MHKPEAVETYAAISKFLEERRAEFAEIPAERKQQLTELSHFVRGNLSSAGEAKLTFICTHNSRRSHLSQIWAKVAADACGLVNVKTFSGGTEATAMNPRVVDSLRRSGFQIAATKTSSDNPVYAVRYSDQCEPLQCFSKVYHQAPNPSEGYCAIMTCSSADQACPIVPGCDLRAPIRYEDPKIADGTPQEASVYDERSRQICREMLYAMDTV